MLFKFDIIYIKHIKGFENFITNTWLWFIKADVCVARAKVLRSFVFSSQLTSWKSLDVCLRKKESSLLVGLFSVSVLFSKTWIVVSIREASALVSKFLVTWSYMVLFCGRSFLFIIPWIAFKTYSLKTY